jgi:alkylation response protein AidB-like acyl-CoA dehydrogenase
MDFRLTEEQELLVSSLKELLEREAPESLIAKLDEEHEFPWKLWKALADNGFSGLGVSEDYGGTPADYTTQMLVGQTLAKYAFPVGFVYSLSMMTSKTIGTFGSPEQKALILGDIIKGGPPVALGISEPQAGSDTASIKTTAVLEGENYVLNGQKIYCTMAHVAKYIMCMTRDPKIENPYKGISMFLLPTNAKGVRVNPLRKVGLWPVSTCEVFIDNVVLPKSALIGELNNGFKQLMEHFEVERLAVGSLGIGAAEAAFEDAAQYASQRIQFGKPIGSFQLVQEMLTNMAIKLENMRNMALKVSWMMDNHMDVRIENALLKLYGARASFEVVDDAMQILGGVGYMMDHRVQRLWRDLRVLRIGGGTDEVMIHIAGPQIVKKYAAK